MRLAILLLALLVVPATLRAQTTLTSSLDNTALTWRTGGNAVWFGGTVNSHDGVDAAQSGRILEGQQSWLETTVSGPGLVAFWWKASSEGSCDYLEFYVGGVLKASCSAELDWKRVFFEVPGGSQVLRWRYVKDIGTDLGSDAGWVDEVVYVPHAGAPTLVVAPPDRTVVTGANVTLRAGLAGSWLACQWFFNETNALPNATTATLTLTNIQPEQAGNYRVAFSNTLGSSISGPAFLTVVPKDPAENVLLFVDGAFANPFTTAMNTSGQAYQVFQMANLLAFNRAVRNANPGKTLVIVDAYNYANDFADVAAFIQNGGRAIVQYWYLGVSGGRPSQELAAALNATVGQELYSPLPVYKWGTTTLFNSVSSPFNLSDSFNLNGQRLNWTTGGDPAAGYTSSRISGQAAIIVGNSGRTILNGFFMEEALSSAAAAKFAQNQIELLVGPPVVTAPVITVQPRSQKAVTGGEISLVAGAGGTPPLTYRWYRNEIEAVAGGTGPTLTLSALTASAAGRYRLVVTNRMGSVTSETAVVTVTNRSAVNRVLLFADQPETSPYRAALNEAGWQHELHSTEAAFNIAVQDADPTTSLVVVNAPKWGHDFRDVVSYIRAGGRALVQYWNLGGDSSLSSALGVSVVGTFSSPLPVYHWGDPGVFSNLASPLLVTETEYTVDGQKLQVITGANAVAGYTSTRTTTEAAIVVGRSGYSIVNGFMMENAQPRQDGITLIKNEVLNLAGQPPATVPFIQTEPLNATTVFGATARFSAVAGGTAPLAYQWYFNDTVRIENATGPTLEITGVQPRHVGAYTLVVSNSAGSRSSQPAYLRGTTLGSISNVILFADDTNRVSPFATALADLNITFRQFNAENLFESAIAGSELETSLGVVDSTLQPVELKALEAFGSAGGRVILQHWGLAQKSQLMQTFGLASAQGLSIPSPVYSWNSSALFAGVGNPLLLVGTGLTTEGQSLEPGPGAWAVAGYQTEAASGQAAIVVANAGRTIVNGFYLKEANPESDGVQLARNEIQAIFALGAGGGAVLVHSYQRTPAGAFLIGFQGTAGAAFTVLGSTDLRTWDVLGSAEETGPGQFQFLDEGASTHAARFYQVRTP